MSNHTRSHAIVSLLSGERSAAQLAAEHGVSEAEIESWKALYLEGVRAAAAMPVRERPRRRARWTLAAAVGACALVAAGAAAQVTDLIQFAGGTPARASEINANFQLVKTWIEEKVGPTSEPTVTLNDDTIVNGHLSLNAERQVRGDNAAHNFHLDPGESGRIYLNWDQGGTGVVIGNGAASPTALFQSDASKVSARDPVTGLFRQVPSTIVSRSCTGAPGAAPASGSCTADCPAGLRIKLAFGMHGAGVDGNGGTWSCGSGMGWRGSCIDQTSCTVNTACATSGMWLECW